MGDEQNKELLDELKLKIRQMSDEQLTNKLKTSYKSLELVYLLVESNRRKDEKLDELNRRILLLENKVVKKRGRKRQTFYHSFKEITDEYLIDLVNEYDGEIGKLERDVGAKRNVLRNRYYKALRLKKIEGNRDSHGNS